MLEDALPGKLNPKRVQSVKVHRLAKWPRIQLQNALYQNAQTLLGIVAPMFHWLGTGGGRTR